MIKQKKLYRVIIVGPTGAGKSQLCNFVRRDLTNSINTVSDSLNSCTQDPFSNTFERNGENYEFIDTAGSNDSFNNDIRNLQKLMDFLKIKRQIDYIILALKFNVRLSIDIREYIATLGKIFTPTEFYNHICIIFTKFPENATKKENNIKEKSIKEINQIIRNIFDLKETDQFKDIKTYFIDTEIDEDNNTFIEKYQDTIDDMLEQIRIDANKYNSIDTTNLDLIGNNAKIRKYNEEKEIERLKKQIEEEKIKKERKERELLRLQQELERQRRREKEERELRMRQEQELRELRMKREQELRRCEEMRRENERLEREKERRKREYEEEINRRIEIINNQKKNNSICIIF